MKKGLLITIIFGALLIVAAGSYAVTRTVGIFANTIKGSGNIITRTIDAPAYDGVQASRAVEVLITDKATNKITIEADDNLMEFVEVKTEDGVLVVSLSNKIRSISNTHVKVTVPANGRIRSLDADSAATILGEVTLQADKFDLDASSAAKIDASIVARECSLDASSASKITVNIAATDCKMEASSASKIDAAMKTTTCEAEASSAAKIILSGESTSCTGEFDSAASFRASDFVVADYTISVSSGSSADINCTRALNATASSGASIDYSGDCPDVTRNMSSGGSVRKN